jgi:hypothetical protein
MAGSPDKKKSGDLVKRWSVRAIRSVDPLDTDEQLQKKSDELETAVKALLAREPQPCPFRFVHKFPRGIVQLDCNAETCGQI